MAAAASSNRIKSTRLSALGRYRLLATIGQGGMAEVFLASLEGVAHFKKLMAIKVLRPELSEDPDGRAMFLEEARLAARLAHPNVIQTTEVGETAKTLYLVMEYLDGQPLSRMMQVSRGEGSSKLPAALFIRILIDTLAGLEYVHQLKDYTGSPLMLVHRDVSPANIFVSYDGQVKILDFGIAKAADGDAQTRAGVLKGKIGYLSPEQLSDAKPDRRVDVYAAGVMLWEALTGRRLWKGIPDMTALAKVTNEGVPSPRTVDPSIPEALEKICVRATARNRDERYPTAAAFSADLEAYLETCGQPSTPRAIGRWMTDTFGEVRADTERLIDRQLTKVRTAPPETLDALVSDARVGDEIPDLPRAETNGTGSVSTPLARPKRWPIIAVVGVAAVCAMALVATRSSRPNDPTPTSSLAVEPPSASTITTLNISATPATAMITLDGVMIGASPTKREVMKGRHVVRIEAPGYTPHVEEVVLDGPKSVAITLASKQQPAMTAQPAPEPIAVASKKQHHHPTAPAPKAQAPKAQAPTVTAPSPAAPAPAPVAPTNKKKIDEENPFAH